MVTRNLSFHLQPPQSRGALRHASALVATRKLARPAHLCNRTRLPPRARSLCEVISTTRTHDTAAAHLSLTDSCRGAGAERRDVESASASLRRDLADTRQHLLASQGEGAKDGERGVEDALPYQANIQGPVHKY